MKRQIIVIDEEKCNGCGLCVPECHEGALTIEEREAEPYDEVKVMEMMVNKGENTICFNCASISSRRCPTSCSRRNTSVRSIMRMEVPCCGGLVQMAGMAAEQAGRRVPLKEVVVGVRGDVLSEEWL